MAAVVGIPLLKGHEASHWIAATTAAQPSPVVARQDDDRISSSASGDRRGIGMAKAEIKLAAGSTSRKSSINNGGSSRGCRDAAAPASDRDASCTSAAAAAASRATYRTGATAIDGAADARGVANTSTAFGFTSSAAAAAAAPAAPTAAAGSGSDAVFGGRGGGSSTTAAARPTGQDSERGGTPATGVTTTAVTSPESTPSRASAAVTGLSKTTADGPVRTGEDPWPACGGKKPVSLPASEEVPSAGQKRCRLSGVSCPRDNKIAFSEHDTPRDSGGLATAVGHGSGGSGGSGAGADGAILSCTHPGGRGKREHPAGGEGGQEDGVLPTRTSESTKRPKFSSNTV